MSTTYLWLHHDQSQILFALRFIIPPSRWVRESSTKYRLDAADGASFVFEFTPRQPLPPYLKGVPGGALPVRHELFYRRQGQPDVMLDFSANQLESLWAQVSGSPIDPERRQARESLIAAICGSLASVVGEQFAERDRNG